MSHRLGLALLLFSSVLANANAGIVIFSTNNPTNPNNGLRTQGFWSATVDNAGTHFVTGSDGSDTARGFLSFDLSTLTTRELIQGATINVQRYNSGGQAVETIEVFDVSTDVLSLHDTNGNSSASIFNDLGTGTSYGSFNIAGTGLSNEILSFTLNASAIADLNAARGGFFSVGLDLVSQDGSDFVFSGSNAPGLQTISLNVTTIPEPNSLALLGAVVVSIGGRRRR